jgi:DNA-binding transcriptional ArsR family regulator
MIRMQAMALLAEPNRREIVRLVWTTERSAGEIARNFKTTFGAVSQHLRRLLDGGLITQRRDGKRLFYKTNRAALGPLALALEAMWTEKLDALKSLAEAEQRRAKPARKTAPRRHRKETP